MRQANSNATVEFSGLGGERDIEIELSGSAGAGTTYVVHCFDGNFPVLSTTGAGTDGALEDLLLFSIGGLASAEWLTVADNNGVPRVRKPVSALHAFPRVFDDDAPFAYAYSRVGQPDSQWVLLDKDFEIGRQRLYAVSPLGSTDPHDFLLLPNGDYLFMSYNSSNRDFSFLTTQHGLQKKVTVGGSVRPCRDDDEDCVDWGTETTRDSAIQVRAPSAAAGRFNWNAWDHMAIEDCLTHRFPDDYAHINSFHWEDGDIVASFRGCNKVLRISSTTSAVVWRLGRSMWSDEQWAAGEAGSGPAPLAIVGDPHGEFCAQHAASLLPNGNLLLYDNGVHCFVNPVTGEKFRESNQFSRGVEYAIDVDSGEAVFQRHHSLHGSFDRVGFAAGHIEALDNGDWLVTWGRGWNDDDPDTALPPDVAVTQVDPETNTEKFSLTVGSGSVSAPLGRALPVSPAALAPRVGPLKASIVRSTGAHTGPASSPTVVVAFNQPVVAPVVETPSVSVSGGTLASVSPLLDAGEPANAFVFTLTPAGDGSVRFSLVAGRACSANGVCTADQRTLSNTLSQVVIRGPAPPPPPPPPGSGGSVGGEGDSGSSSRPRDDHGNSVGRATRIPPSWRTPGQLHTRSDVDYFTLTAPHAGVFVVETSGSTDTRGTVWQAGVELASTDSGGSGQNFRLSVQVAAGPVVIAVRGNGRQTGHYTLRTALVMGSLENPAPASFQSGLGVISGWVCEAEGVTIEIEKEDGTGVELAAAYGTERADTATICGGPDTGFGVLFNWNLLGDGEHAVVVLVDGIELGRAAVTVTTLGAEFMRGAAGECVVADFPSAGETVALTWQASNQNFVIAGEDAPRGANRAGIAGVGQLENPGPNSFQSGIGVISGWVCEAEAVTLEITPAGGEVVALAAAYGTERGDTLAECGDTDNGFGLLFNWNLLDDGEHKVVALADGLEVGRVTVRVTTLGEEFVRGAAGECVVADFPTPGETVTLEWQESQQNFAITGVD